MRAWAWLAAALTGLALLAGAAALETPGATRLALADPDGARLLLGLTLADGEPVLLLWHNSLFNLDVTESFEARSGVLLLRQVEFADPTGRPPPVVGPQDLDDLYHTGGPFRATGLAKPFQRVMYRVGDIGNPRLRVRGRDLVFKDQVGFGGRVLLTTRPARLYERLPGFD